MGEERIGARRRGKPQQILPTEGEVFREGVVLSGDVFSDHTFNRTAALRGYITDCLFRNCTFEQCSFQRCDFEAVVFESCTFNGCDFSGADFRSVEFSQCAIADGHFPNGAIKACTFTDCELTRCRFYRQSFEGNRLTSCLLDGCRFHRATVLHIEFAKCAFRKSSIADCTSLYHLFDDCSFIDSEINVDSVPLSFGLTRENLLSLRLLWQGKRIKKPEEVERLLDDLLSSVGARGWSMAACVLAINFSLAPTRDAFQLAFAGVLQNVQTGRPLRHDELEFLARIIEILIARREMPFLPVIKGLDLIIDISERGQGTYEEALRPLFHALREAELSAVRTWDHTWRLLQPHRHRMVEVEFVFEKNPGVALQPILEELQHVLGDESPVPKLLDTRSGSYIELITIPIGTLAAVTVSMGMLVRIVDHLIVLRGKLGILVAAQLPAAFQARALEPPSPVSTDLAAGLRTLSQGLLAGRAPLTAEGADAIAAEIREIRVLTDPDPQAP